MWHVAMLHRLHMQRQTKVYDPIPLKLPSGIEVYQVKQTDRYRDEVYK